MPTYVTTQRILNKCIEKRLLVGCIVWPWWCLFQHQLPVEILIRIPTVQIRTASCTYILTTFRLKYTNKIASNDYILQKIKKYSYNCNDRIEITSVCIWDFNFINIEKRRKLIVYCNDLQLHKVIKSAY